MILTRQLIAVLAMSASRHNATAPTWHYHIIN